MAIRHQLSSCYKLNFVKINYDEIELGPFEKSTDNNVAPCLKHVSILNKPYSAGTVCITRFATEGIVFGIIKSIVVKEDGIKFQVKEFETLFFSSHYQAYRVTSDVDCDDEFIDINCIPKLPPCLYVKKFDEEFIATRYKLT